MNKPISRFGCNSVLMATLLVAQGCGTVSRGLVESCTRNEPDLKQFNAVYWKAGSAWRSSRLIVDYSVEEPRYPKQEKRAASYWAELVIDDLAYDEISHPKDGVRIHRRPLSKSGVSGYDRLSMVTLDDVRKESGRMYAWDYLGRTRTDDPPRIVVASNWLVVQDRSFKNRGYKRFCPTRSYIPPEQYPKLVALYPFAILGDIVAFPLVLGFSGWHD